MRQRPFVVAEPWVGYKSLVGRTAMALEAAQRQTGTVWGWAQEGGQELEQDQV